MATDRIKSAIKLGLLWYRAMDQGQGHEAVAVHTTVDRKTRPQEEARVRYTPRTSPETRVLPPARHSTAP